MSQESDTDIEAQVTLENMFLGQGLVWQQVWRHLEGLAPRSTPSSLSSPTYISPGSLSERTGKLKDSLTALGGDQADDHSHISPSVFDPNHRVKRRRVCGKAEESQHASLLKDQQGLPPEDLVDSLVDIYFERIHPWIPMLHIRKFREQLQDPLRRPEMSTVLLAITSLCVRFSDDRRLKDPYLREELATKSRETVILRSMESFSVKNLQALIICAFDIVSQ